MSTDERWSPSPEFDDTVSSPARYYDYLLGGKDNYAVDREAAEHLIEIIPQLRPAMRANRGFLVRAVRFLAESGITQFVDIGSGLPTQGNVHEIAQGVNPDARVVYVDNDPIVLAHGRALLEENSHTAVIAGDMLQPNEIITDPRLGEFIDWSQPVAVLMVAVLHFVTDDRNPGGIVQTFADRMVPGSYLVISQDTADGRDPDYVAQIKELYDSAVPAGVTFRSRPEVEAFFDGFTLLEPGVVPVSQWRPDPDTTPTPDGDWMIAGVGYKH